jgi:hypothetical protein
MEENKMIIRKTMTVTLTEEIIKRVEELQEKTGMNKSATVSMLLSEALDSKAAIGTIEKMLKAFGENGENIGKMIEESKKKAKAGGGAVAP